MALAFTGVPQQRPAVPWGVGESFEYVARKALVGGGTARLWVDGIDTVRGVPTWRFGMTSDISVFGGLVTSKSSAISWTGISPFVSRRFTQAVVQKPTFNRENDYRIFGDSGFFRNLRPTDTGKVAAPRDAIDDVAFFYFIRTVPLQVGKTYQFTNYFRRDRNPVTVQVQRRTACELPGGVKAQCLVLHPVVDDPPHGLLMKNRDAHVWITDDAQRIITQIGVNYGEMLVTLKLEKITRGR